MSKRRKPPPGPKIQTTGGYLNALPMALQLEREMQTAFAMRTMGQALNLPLPGDFLAGVRPAGLGPQFEVRGTFGQVLDGR